MAIKPNNGAFIDSLGWAYFKLGRLDKARTELERASQLVADPVIFDHLGDLYAAMGRYEGARTAWLLSLELDPEQDAVRHKLEQLPHVETSTGR
jgi:Flp pilus assembly protein TadD